MIQASNVLAASGPNIGTKILKHVNNARPILIILKVNSNVSLVPLWPQSGTAKNVWAVPQEPFSISTLRHAKAALLDSFLRLQP